MDQNHATAERSADEPRVAPRCAVAGVGALSDPLRLNDAMGRFGSRLAADPSPLVGAWFDLARSWSRLWTYGTARMLGADISAQGYLSGQHVADTWRAVRADDLRPMPRD